MCDVTCFCRFLLTNIVLSTGKTTLVKALTGKRKLVPDDKFFATLDTTAHRGRLPSGLAAVFIDTIGFISDLPHELFESFEANLEDIKNAVSRSCS